MIVMNTDGVVMNLAPRIPTAHTPTGAEHHPNGLPAGTPSPTHSRAGAILLEQLAGDERDLPGGHGRDGLAAATVQHPLADYSAFIHGLLP